MAKMFTVSIIGDQQLIANFVAMPQQLQASLTRRVRKLALLLQRHLQVDYLSGPTGEHTLSVQKGALRRSAFNTVVSTSAEVTGTVGYGADVPYAAAHEYGATINIPEIVPTTAQALHFVINGKDVFAKRVRAHTVILPERAPLRTAFADMKEQIEDELSAATEEGLK